MTRRRVYEIIDEERDYQDKYHCSAETLEAELVMMKVYLDQALADWTYKADSRHQVRKLVALGIRCLENHECPRRVGVSEENENVNVEDYIDEEVPDLTADPTIPFTKEEVKKYLDKCIRFWRERRDVEKDVLASYYVDAYQSVRISVFGKLLEIEREQK